MVHSWEPKQSNVWCRGEDGLARDVLERLGLSLVWCANIGPLHSIYYLMLLPWAFIYTLKGSVIRFVRSPTLANLIITVHKFSICVAVQVLSQESELTPSFP